MNQMGIFRQFMKVIGWGKGPVCRAEIKGLFNVNDSFLKNEVMKLCLKGEGRKGGTNSSILG